MISNDIFFILSFVFFLLGIIFTVAFAIFIKGGISFNEYFKRDYFDICR